MIFVIITLYLRNGILVWEALARCQVPAKIIEVVRQFLVGMRACVWLDNDEGLDWSEVEQGVRQGCVLSALLFQHVLRGGDRHSPTAVSEDPDIMTDLVHLDEDLTAVGPEEALAKVAWGV